MKAFILVLTVLAAVAFASDEDVIKLTQANFDSIVNNEEIVLVKFFAPWCGHCKHLAPEYIKAATRLLENDPPVKLADVDCTVETELATRFDIHGYPTLKVFRKGVASDYNGPREADGIVKYMKAQAGPAAKLIETAEALDTFTAKPDDVSFVAFVKEGSELDKAYMQLANAQREEFSFAVVRSKDLVASKHNGKEGVVAYRPFDGEPKTVEFDGKPDALKQFVIESAVPVAGVYKPDVVKRYELLGLPRLILFTKVSEYDPSGTRYVLNRLRRAAADFKGKLAFVAMDKSSREFNEFGFPEEQKAAVVIMDRKGKYKSSIEELNIQALKDFAAEFVAGKLEVYVKSEPIPEKNDEPVRVVVGKTFETEVANSNKDVLIMAYAPWCGHCKALHPKWDELAKKLEAHNDKVVIAKIDATANDLPPQYNIRGFPTIFWVARGKADTPEVYNGGREVAELEEYIRRHVSTPLKDEL